MYIEEVVKLLKKSPLLFREDVSPEMCTARGLIELVHVTQPTQHILELKCTLENHHDSPTVFQHVFTKRMRTSALRSASPARRANSAQMVGECHTFCESFVI